MRTTHRRIEAVRRFSRFYTRHIGLLDDGILESPFSLTEARVISELAHQEAATATQIASELGLDAGYLSRILRRLGRRGLLEKQRSGEDRRRVYLELSWKGKEAFAQLNAGSARQIRELLCRLSTADQKCVVEAMGMIERMLGKEARSTIRGPFTLRPHRPGDMGWVVQRHGELYAESHEWDERFEAMCAEIGARFLDKYDPRVERSWIAERDGERVGAVFLVQRSKTVGQLRLLFVEPGVRGLGIGARLVSECVGHARHVGYKRMMLDTVSGLGSARRLYEAQGFELVHEEPGHAWGQDYVAQRFELKL